MTPPIARELVAAIDAAGWRTDPAGDPGSAEGYMALLRVLHDTGRRDLPLGRLLEGHVDAVQIVQRLGTAEQVAALRRLVADGAMLGVWNATIPGEPLVLEGERLEGGRLTGAKSYASGAGVLTHALVIADTPAGPQLILGDLSRTPPAIDRDWWRVTGMQRSQTHRVRWADASVAAADLIGDPHAYAREPWFSGGALRFVSVHAGGIAGLFDGVRAHLEAAGRGADPFQLARLAELFMLAEGAAATVRGTAMRWFVEREAALVAAARMGVLAAAERAMTIAREAVGVQAAFLDHPLSRLLTDLDVYIRQPVPDLMRQRIGEAAMAGTIAPVL